MKKTNIAAIAFLSLAALAAPFTARAVDKMGAIFEILPVDENGAALTPSSTPISSGTVRFAVRLFKPGLASNPFRLRHVGIHTWDIDMVLNRPAIGVYVNGAFTLAYLETVKQRSDIFTDFIFSYAVTPGDLAMPMLLADKNKNLINQNPSTSITDQPGDYYLNFLDDLLGLPAWQVDNSTLTEDGKSIKDEATHEAEFYYGNPSYPGVKTPDTPTDGSIRRLDYDLSGCRFNIKTVDFDSRDESDSYWRSVHEHPTAAQAVSTHPTLVVSGVPTTNKVKRVLYVWSENPESVVLTAGGDIPSTNIVKRSILTNAINNVSVDRIVGEIEIVPGKTTYEFRLRGVKATNDAVIVMSPYKNFNYTKAGDRREDYATRIVRCVGPQPASVSLGLTAAEVTATSDYRTPVSTLTVSLSENPVDHDFEATISNLFTEATYNGKWWDYLRMSANPTVSEALFSDETRTPTGYPTLLFRAGDILPSKLRWPTASGTYEETLNDGKIYLYAIRSDGHVNGTGGTIRFTVHTADATASKPSGNGGIDGWGAPSASLLAIYDPIQGGAVGEEGVVASAGYAGSINTTNMTVGVEYPLNISVADAYADMNSADGYVVEFESNVNAGFTALPGRYKLDGGYLVSTNDSTKPIVVYTSSGSKQSRIRLTSPVSGKKSVATLPSVTVRPPAGYYVETQSGESVFFEGDPVGLKVTIDSEFGSDTDMWAFIAGSDSDLDAIDCLWKAQDGGVGVRIPANATTPDQIRGLDFVVADGGAAKNGTTQTYIGDPHTYEVVFLNQSTWTTNASAKVTQFANRTPLVIRTKNVLPRVDYVAYSDVGASPVPIYDAGTTVGPFPIGVPKTLSVVVDEPGILDQEGTNSPFKVRWRINPQYGSPQTIEVVGDPNETSTNVTFESAGTYTIYVDLQDKDIAPRFANRDPDLDDGSYAQTGLNKSFMFKVEVIDQPAITVEHAGTYYENESVEAGGEPPASLTVKLGMNDCNFAMDVKLLIAPNNAASAAPGTFLLQTSSSVTSNGVEVVDGESYQSYTVRFQRQATEVPIYVLSMDGTADSRLTGFKAIVTNITTTVVDGTGGRRACDYYLGVSPPAIKVVNVDPYISETLDVSPVPGTNAIAAAIGSAPRAIQWWNIEDVASDFRRGMTIRFEGGGGWGPNTYTNLADALAAGAVGFTPVFDSSGEQRVRMIVTDPDRGSSQEIVWIYDVAKAKSMYLTAHGPASGDVSKYASASGIGQGRVWAESSSPISAKSFSSLINCGLASSWRIYGYGYKVGDVDNGDDLHRPDGFGGYTTGYYVNRDTPLDGTGSNWNTNSTTAAFRYVANSDENGNPVDSFLYAWMVKAESKEGGSGGFAFLNEATAPEYVKVGSDSGKTVTLPTEQDDKGNYADTTVEAIFSIEYLASDNMGDINLDGIPDVYVNKFGFGLVNTDEGTISGTDLTKLNAFNDDEDYLPPIETSIYGTLIPGLSGTWATLGRPFTAKLEIRGNGPAMNDAPANNPLTRVANVEPDRVYTDPRFDSKSTLDGYDGLMPVEYLAWLDFAAANGLDPTNKANWVKWSPERPTDPTLEDTDGDGLPDGYEYFLWYRAHVGYSHNGEHRYLTGRRYDPKNPGEGVFISSEEIKAAFDPAVNNAAFFAAQDTDNDGLPDLVEFAIGTNPVDFDTDGDGLPDGFEIMISGTSPLLAYTTIGICDAMRNYDGDAMAYTCPTNEVTKLIPPAKHVKSLSTFALVDPSGDTDGIQWYVMPTDEAPTNIVYALEGSPGYLVKVGDVQYITTDKPAFVTRGAATYLAADLSPDVTWTAGTYGSDGLVRLMPTRLVAGTLLADVPTNTAAFGYLAFGAAVKDSMTAWRYGRAVDTQTTGDNMGNQGGFGFLAIGRYQNAPSGKAIAALPAVDQTIAYLHHLVYQEFGFDPRTAWNANTPLGTRWGIEVTSADGETTEAKANTISATFYYTGIAARTREFTLYDEFLVLSFFLNSQDTDDGDGTRLAVRPSSANPWHKIWSRYTTNGRGPGEPDLVTSDENYTGREIAEGSSDENGADTDGDGVPDGWELYVMSGPKKAVKISEDETRYYFRFPAPYDDGYLSAFGPFVPFAKDASYTDNIALGGYETTGGDGDDLTEYQEFAGTDTTIYYAQFSTTVTRPEEHVNWLNKFFPTDPWNKDTDGDGRTDSQEKGDFAYGTPADDGKLVTIPGGGLNPLSVDTDFDGLPDGWEQQFKGKTIYSGDRAEYAKVDGAAAGNPLQGLVDGMDGTVPDAFNIVTGSVEPDGAIGTYYTVRSDGSKMFGHVNRDYDNDGLENWQEYITGTMRCWRYDDPFTPWDGMPDRMYWDEDGNFSPNYTAINAMFGAKTIDTSAADGGRAEFWYKTLVDKWSPIYNPRLITGQTTGAQYFSQVTNVWDLAYLPDAFGGAYYYFKDRIGDADLEKQWVEPFVLSTFKMNGEFVTKPRKYISCSPIEADSDHDGMDDFYELFHGMNPLLGASSVRLKSDGPCDIVFDAWMTDDTDPLFEAWNANDPKANMWAYRAAVGSYYKTGLPPRGNGYDFEYFPWLNGLATADPDGDDIRNQSEAIMPKLATSTWLHTDPTPLWMTDTSYERSLTRLYFRMPGRDAFVPTPGESFTYNGKTYWFKDFGGWQPEVPMMLPPRFVECQQDLWWGLYGANSPNWIVSFEENEGYDTDHDAMSDLDEAAGELRTASDPQDANSPNRRQAMYFQGPSNPSALQLPLEVAEQYPVSQEGYPDEMTFFKFTVECWVMAESLADATLVERAIWSDPSKAGDQEYVRKNFQLGIKDGKWYAKFDSNGTLIRSSVEILSSSMAEAGVWHHIAATYDGSAFVLYLDGQEAANPVMTSLQPEYGSSAVVVRRKASAVDKNLISAHAIGDYWYDAEYSLKTIVVGASLKTQMEGGSSKAFDVNNAAGWGYYNRFFKGYIDEVRIWDGARTMAEIFDDYSYRRRYTRDTALANREAFYADWLKFGNRYKKDADGDDVQLMPELIYHFSFDSVPGGPDEMVVTKAPGGFGSGTPWSSPLAAVLARPTDWNVSWWTNIVSAFGSVYPSKEWVQWVPNTVAHLPRFDGTTLDSFFWSDNTCGGTNGFFRFAMTAEPASRWVQMAYSDTYTRATYKAPGARHHLVCMLDGLVVSEAITNDVAGTMDRFNKFRFTGRHAVQAGADLLPLGGAYAKSSTTLWDGHGATTPWEITSDDSDGNGLPDTWEEYAVANYNPVSQPLKWSTVVKWKRPTDGASFYMTAGAAYRRDLVYGRVVARNSDGDLDVQLLSQYAQTADEDNSGTPDWWDELYGVYGHGGTTDTDNDGLSNYMEYLASEKFALGLMLDPKMPRSDTKTLDYFLPIGSLYLGEMFTDHDHVEDWWERTGSGGAADANVWDAHLDADGSGWSNFAIRRSVDDTSTWVQVGSETNLYTVTFDVGSNERSIFDATNTATIAAKELFWPDYGWEHHDDWTGFSDATKVRYTLVGSKPIIGYGGRPRPKVELTVRYGGNLLDGGKTAALVVEAYSDGDMMAPDAVFSNTVQRGVNKITLHMPSVGALKEGRNTFVAYMLMTDSQSEGGGNSSGESSSAGYEVGMPFGVARDVEVGWNSARASIDLTEVSAVTPRIKLWSDSDSDRIARFGLSQPTNSTTATLPEAKTVRVRVVRLSIDDLQWPEYAVASPIDRVVLDREFSVEARDFIHEGDFLGNGAFDLDWATLADDIGKVPGTLCTNVAYAVVLGDGNASRTPNDRDAEIMAHPLLVTRRFEVGRTAPTPVVGNGASIVHVAQPTFRWKIENEEPWASAYGTTYTAFRIRVMDYSTFAEVYDSGVQKMPTPDADGVYSWTAPLYVDCPSPSGGHSVFSNLKDYYWCVYTYNAKYRSDAVGSAGTTFRMNVTELDQDTFGIGLNVSYAGPVANLAGRIHVQAFTTPDFVGDPVSEAVVTNVSSSALHPSAGSPVHLGGLKAGTYYVRAYIDTDYDWQLDSWESWGYLNERDKAAVVGTKDIFTPTPVVVGPGMASTSTRMLFIEDRDTDGDGFPDAWEAEQNGMVFDPEKVVPVEGDAELVAVNPTLAANLSKASQGYVATAFSALSSASGFAMVSGLPLSTATSLLMSSSLPAEVVDGTVEISSIALDRESGEVVLGIGAETAPAAVGNVDAAVASLYSLTVARGATVTVKVYCTETLAGEWRQVAEETLTVDPDGTEIRAPLSAGIDLKSGFFKVELETPTP